MQTQGFPFQENSPTGRQRIPYEKGVCYNSTSVGRKDGHMEHVPNPYTPPQTASPFSQYLITFFFFSENVLIQKQIYHIVLLLDFSAISQQRHYPKAW